MTPTSFAASVAPRTGKIIKNGVFEPIARNRQKSCCKVRITQAKNERGLELKGLNHLSTF